MKRQHSPSSKDEIDTHLDNLKAAVMNHIDRVEDLGEDRQRIEFFSALRDLIVEKDMQGDDIAVSVLSWAYERLAENPEV